MNQRQRRRIHIATELVSIVAAPFMVVGGERLMRTGHRALGASVAGMGMGALLVDTVLLYQWKQRGWRW